MQQLKTGDTFILTAALVSGTYDFNVEVLLATEQVIRLELKHKKQVIKLQKDLRTNAKQPWNVMDIEPLTAHPDAGENLILLYSILNKKLTGKALIPNNPYEH